MNATALDLATAAHTVEPLPLALAYRPATLAECEAVADRVCAVCVDLDGLGERAADIGVGLCSEAAALVRRAAMFAETIRDGRAGALTQRDLDDVLHRLRNLDRLALMTADDAHHARGAYGPRPRRLLAPREVL